MAIYDRPTKLLMAEWAAENLKPGQEFERSAPVQWFKQRYPRINPNTVGMHVEGMAVNSSNRRHHPSIRPGSGYDLFWKIGRNRFRLWDPAVDAPPVYKEQMDAGTAAAAMAVEETEEDNEPRDVDSDEGNASRFAYEEDLKNYLVRNLNLIEPGLRLYEEDGITGIEFPVGGRYIDILAVDRDGAFVVIELKVSRGYDRVIGQLLRYVSWIEKNVAGGKRVRGVIVAQEITEDLRLACSRLSDIVRLVEYEISFRLKTL